MKLPQLFSFRPDLMIRFPQVILIASAIGSLAFPGCGWDSARRDQEQKLKTMTIAVSGYRETLGNWPPVYVTDADNQPLHSWRVLILPFVEANSFYEEYDFSSSWNSSTNEDLRDGTRHYDRRKFPNPAAVGGFYMNDQSKPRLETVFVVLTKQPLEEHSFRDGQKGFYLSPKQSFLILEVDNTSIHWMEPRDAATSAGYAQKALLFDDIRAQIVRSIEISESNAKGKIRNRDETLEYLESKVAAERQGHHT